MRETKLDKELEKFHFGQFLFLYFLGKNIDYTTFRAILKAIAPESNEVVEDNEGIFLTFFRIFFLRFLDLLLFFPIVFLFEGIALQALAVPSAPERRGSAESNLPAYTDSAPQAATKDPYPYPSIEPYEKDTGDEEVNVPRKEL